MSYTKTNWVDGETPINATNLNNMEGGIENNDTNKLDKTSVKTAKTTSDTDTYSCNYIENIIDRMKTVNLNNWFNVPYANGSGLRFNIPIFNPEKLLPTVTIESCSVYTDNGEWVTIPPANVIIQTASSTYVTLYIEVVGTGITLKNIPYLVSLNGTITCK